MLYILLLIFGSFSLKAQEIRAGGGLHFNFKRTFRIEMESQYRFSYLSPEINRSFIQAAFRYESKSGFGSKFNYRNGLDLFNRDRFSLDLFYDNERQKKKISLGTRLRFQSTTDPEENLSSGNQRLRLKLASGLKISKFAKPYHNIELFYSMNTLKAVERIRFSFGLNSRISRTLRLNTFYKVDYYFPNIKNKFDHILGCMIIYKIRYNNQDTMKDDIIDL